MGKPGSIGPASKRYNWISRAALIVSVFIGGLIAELLGLSPWITMGGLALVSLLVTLPLGVAAGRERQGQNVQSKPRE
ncbi:hypothetical protein GCM10023081_00260 [Arthrobacter ginkgonis]|uniref:Uncharacterized protein n=1 Tax=Arthrobacter ginkgonis TaxID=1630594 RepID=A0ABP7BMR4_9MICC